MGAITSNIAPRAAQGVRGYSTSPLTKLLEIRRERREGWGRGKIEEEKKCEE